MIKLINNFTSKTS